MEEKESKHKISKPFRILIRIVSGLLILLAVIIFGVYILFNFFGTKLLREMIQKKIYASSQGLYTLDFSDLKINIFTRNISVYDFSLTPDTVLYRKLKQEGKAKKTLYKISFRQLTLLHLNFREIWTNRNIQMREMLVVKPEIVLMGFPDTLTSKKGQFKNVYEDVYPLASKVFKDIQIDSIYVEKARIVSDKQGKPGKQTLGQYEFSALLRDVAINPFSYYNRQRVFYSHDIDFVVHNVRYSLTDSLYFLQAEEVGFNLVKRKLYGKNISLRPNFHSKRLGHARQGTFFQVDVPDFSIDGINLYAALTEQKVHLKKVSIDFARLKVFQNSSEEARDARMKKGVDKKKKPINKADLFTVIAGKLKSIELDTLLIREASLDYFRNITDKNPELRVARLDIAVDDFKLDSVAHLKKNRILFSKNIGLNLYEIILRLRDQIHVLNAGHVYLSTKTKILDIEGGMVYPDKELNLQNLENMKNTISVLLPDLRFNNIDLLKVFYKQDLVFTNLLIESPDVNYTKYRPPVKKIDVRFRKPGDFFEESNDDLVYNLLKKYVNSIKGDSIIVNKGFLGYQQYADSTDQKIASGSFDLKMFDFMIDSVHGMNQQGYFYSKDFDFDLRSFVFLSPDKLNQIKVNRLHIVTKDSLIEADSISFDKTREPATTEVRRKSNVSMMFTLDNLFLQGLNHKKLFLEKILQANILMLSNPRISIKSGDPVKAKQSQDNTQAAASNEFIKILNISKLIILKGDLSFDGLERTKSSYFKLKDIEFSVLNLKLQLPDRGARNGSIRFDSIDLSLKPLRMIVMDSAYEIRCDDIQLNSYPLDIKVSGINILPMGHSGGQSPGKTTVAAKIPRLVINDFYFDRALFEKKWIIGSIEIDNPEADISLFNKKDSKTGKIPLAFPYNAKAGTFRLDNLFIRNARALIHLHDTSGRVKDYPLEDLQISMNTFLLDSLHSEGIPGVPLFNAGDISVSVKGMNFILKDSLYTLGFTKAGFSTGKRRLLLDSLVMTPNFPNEEFYKKMGFQNDILRISIPGIEINNLDLGKLISQNTLHAGSVVLSNPRIESFRDKRIRPIRPGKRFLYQDQIKKLPIPLAIDTVKMVNGYARYSEQTGDEPGHVFFDRMNAVVLNLTNDSSVLKKNRIMTIDDKARFMGKGPSEGHFRFDMLNPRDTMWWNATIDSVDMKDINPMLSKLLPAKISYGFIEKANISQVSANDSFALGNIDLYYRNLYVELQLVTSGSFIKLKNEVITLLANAVLPDENPDYKGSLRNGIICFRRDTTKGFFNFLWKSTFSGLKSSMGFNSREQKEIKKKLKRKAR